MSDPQAFQLSFEESDIAVLTFDMPEKSANILSSSILQELETHLDELEQRDDLAGLIICSAKPGIFIAGADLREFAKSLDIEPEKTIQMCNRGQQLFQRLSKCNYVTVAAIDGICVGGGAELVIWCDRRVMTTNPKTQFGFPEVKLGLFPGWGGTARTPRMIGLSNAVELITGGDSISAAEAMKMNLANDLVQPDQLRGAAIGMIRAEQKSGDYLTDRKAWQQPIDICETELTFLGAIASGYITQQTKGHYPAPLAALEVMLSAAGEDIDAACEMEAEGMAELFGSPVNAALLNVFFLGDRNKKDTGIDAEGVVPEKIKSLSVIGAGIMGSGIAAVNVRRGVRVTITDAAADVLPKSVSRILEEVSYNKEIKGPDIKKAMKMAPLITATTSDEQLVNSDLVLEAVVENLGVKQQLFARIEPKLSDTTILASNTSTIPIGEMAKDLKHPERFCGIHYFNPVRKMPLVEVIRGAQSSDQTIATVVAYCKSINKSPIVVNDGPGFLVNRMLLPYMNEAIELLLDGVTIPQVERAAKGFGMKMGPITLFDVVGLDTAFYAGKRLYDAFPKRMAVSPVIPRMVKAGRLGQKTGLGFYDYSGKKSKGILKPDIYEIFADAMHEKQDLSTEQITHRLFLPMLLEATRILEDGIVRDIRDIDLGVIYGIGFPPFKGGLLYWADCIGLPKIVELLKPLEALGERMKPTELLKEMAANNRKFYDQ